MCDSFYVIPEHLIKFNYFRVSITSFDLFYTVIFFFFFFPLFAISWAAPASYGGSQARGGNTTAASSTGTIMGMILREF